MIRYRIGLLIAGSHPSVEKRGGQNVQYNVHRFGELYLI